MRSANYAGRVGALAVAAGIGVGMAATPWAASAKPPDPGSPSSSDSPSSLSTGPVIDVEQTQRTGIEHDYLDERCDARADRGRHLIRDRPSSVARARGAYIAVYLVNDPFEPETLPPNWQPPPPPPLDDDPPF